MSTINNKILSDSNFHCFKTENGELIFIKIHNNVISIYNDNIYPTLLSYVNSFKGDDINSYDIDSFWEGLSMDNNK